jgi:endonuclease YncB( thermonuclease family)
MPNPAISLRLNGIDTAEKRGSPPCEKALAKKATKFTHQFVSGGVVTVSNVKLGKYAGRALGSVSVEGKNLVEALIQAGHGRAYNGGARGSWCD